MYRSPANRDAFDHHMDADSRLRQYAMLLSGLMLIGLLWGIVLPRLAADPEFRALRREFREAGLDPSAFSYTDHSCVIGN